MAGNIYIEKQKVLHFIDRAPFKEEDGKRWRDELEVNDVTQAFLDDVREKLLAIPADQFASEWMRVKFSTELATLTRQWRMSTASKQFSHRK